MTQTLEIKYTPGSSEIGVGVYKEIKNVFVIINSIYTLSSLYNKIKKEQIMKTFLQSKVEMRQNYLHYRKMKDEQPIT